MNSSSFSDLLIRQCFPCLSLAEAVPETLQSGFWVAVETCFEVQILGECARYCTIIREGVQERCKAAGRHTGRAE